MADWPATLKLHIGIDLSPLSSRSYLELFVRVETCRTNQVRENVRKSDAWEVGLVVGQLFRGNLVRIQAIHQGQFVLIPP